MPKVFINYRAQEQAGYAALLDRELARRFGREPIFLAARSIAPGDDFADAILHNLRQCAVLLAIIGPGWLRFVKDRASARYEADRALDSCEADWVRREIAEALTGGVRVIPVLVESAAMPDEADLPDDIRALTRCQYLRVHHRTIDDDVARILAEIDKLLPGLGEEPGRPRPLDRTRTLYYQVVAPHRSSCRIGVITGTIRDVRCADIWVNSENTDMEMARHSDFSISGIIRYWGATRDDAGRVVTDDIADELARRVGGRRPVAAGATFRTGPGQLARSNNVRHVIHVAAVLGEPGAGYRQVRDVAACVTNVLVAAERLSGEHGPAGSILFPLLGVGVGADPVATARAMVSAATGYLANRPRTGLRAIYFLAFTDVELAAIAGVAAATPGLVPAVSPVRGGSPG